MSQPQSQHSHSLSEEEDLFKKLAPSLQEKPKLSSVNLLLKKSLDKELQKKLQQSKKNRRDQRRSRSRQRRKNTRGLIEEGASKQAVIVISDDNQQESDEQINKFRALERSIYQPIECYHQQAGLSYRQRQKIDRLMERGMRHFREGKVRDQLSFQIFNTIEAYFK